MLYPETLYVDFGYKESPPLRKVKMMKISRKGCHFIFLLLTVATPSKVHISLKTRPFVWDYQCSGGNWSGSATTSHPSGSARGKIGVKNNSNAFKGQKTRILKFRTSFKKCCCLQKAGPAHRFQWGSEEDLVANWDGYIQVTSSNLMSGRATKRFFQYIRIFWHYKLINMKESLP